jgi:hypothetical protein
MAQFGLSTSPPAEPEADFAIYIQFEKDAERPQRIFRAADGLITAFQRLDTALAAAISPSIEPVLVLEDIEAGSLKIWLRDRLRDIDDQALHKLDWKPAVGKYLVAAKYAFVHFVNDEERRGKKGSLSDLRKEFLRLASETDIKKMADYSPPDASELIAAGGEIAAALGQLNPQDSARLITSLGDQQFNLTINWGPETLEQLSVKETFISPSAPMILAVKRPDYLGNAQWEFKHGTHPIRARIDDKEWLERFQKRQVDVRPGDSLKAVVSISRAYGYDNELIYEAYVIERVTEVLGPGDDPSTYNLVLPYPPQ